MGLFLEKNTEKGKVGIWKLTENEEQLFSMLEETTHLKNTLSGIKTSSRRKQLLGTRVLLNQLLQQEQPVLHDEYGKPHLAQSNHHISISHSGKWVAVAIDTAPTGLDIQEITPRIFKIKHKFLNEQELEQVALSENELDMLHIYWSVKEALYKLYGKKELIFKEHLLADPFPFQKEGKINARIRKASYDKKVLLSYQKIENFVLVYVLNS